MIRTLLIRLILGSFGIPFLFQSPADSIEGSWVKICNKTDYADSLRIHLIEDGVSIGFSSSALYARRQTIALSERDNISTEDKTRYLIWRSRPAHLEYVNAVRISKPEFYTETTVFRTNGPNFMVVLRKNSENSTADSCIYRRSF